MRNRLFSKFPVSGAAQSDSKDQGGSLLVIKWTRFKLTIAFDKSRVVVFGKIKLHSTAA